jgi:predicted dehydrogenase
MTKTRMIVVGAGRLGGFHAQKLAARDDVELVAVVDPVVENCNRVAALCKTEALTDYASLLSEIDGAVIAAPTSLHYRIGREFLEAGVPILLEKPICTSRHEADELVALARRRGVVLQVGHIERFSPAYQAAVEQIHGPRYIEAVRSSGFTFRSTDVGVVLDLMIHDIDLAISMAGCRVQNVEAIGTAVVGPHEDVANARLEFENGCVASLSASRVSYECIRRMHAWSSEGFASIDFATRKLTTVRPSETLSRGKYHVDKLTPQELEYQKAHFAEEHLPKREQTFDAVDNLALESADFVTAIRTGRDPLVTGEAGRDALAVAERILACLGRAAEFELPHRKAA